VNEPIHPLPEARPEPPYAAAGSRPQYYIRLTPPTLTRVLLAANVAVFVGMIVYGYWAFGTWDGTQDGRVLLTFGAKDNVAIDAGEIWRLFTAMFIHIGPLHLLFNLYALNALGPMVEGYFGHSRFAAIYLVAGLAGSVASYWRTDALSAGASGAIFGLAGAITVYFFKYRENFGARGRAILQNMLVIIGFNLVLGYSMPGIDNWGHIGGLIGGALMAVGLLPQYQRPGAFVVGQQAIAEQDRRLVEFAWVMGVLVLLWLTFRWAGQ
jgi:rhomboid protease GluP